MSLLNITIRKPNAGNAILWELFHTGKTTIDGREIRLGTRELPTPRIQGAAVVWEFDKAVKVATPGPDANLNEIRQYKDRIELSVWPWANVTIETE